MSGRKLTKVGDIIVFYVEGHMGKRLFLLYVEIFNINEISNLSMS